MIWVKILNKEDGARGFPGGSYGKMSACNGGRLWFDPWVRKSPWRRKWQPTPVLLPEKSHGQWSLVGSTVHGVVKSRTWLSDFSFTFIIKAKAVIHVKQVNSWIKHHSNLFLSFIVQWIWTFRKNFREIVLIEILIMKWNFLNSTSGCKLAWWQFYSFVLQICFYVVTKYL